MPIPEELRKYAPVPKTVKDNQWNVFLSYRSVDRTWVLNLYDVLTELGYKVFLDQYVLKAGDLLINQLEDGLENSLAGILIWSNATGDSVWVNQEYNTLQRKATEGKEFVFVPVKLDNTALPSFARNRIYIDFSTYPEGPNGGELLRLLYAVEGKPLPEEVIWFADQLNEASSIAAAQVRAALKQGRAEKLIQLFEEGGIAWQTSSALGCKVADGLIKLKKNTEAIAILDRLQKDFTKALRPKQLKALALARRGENGDLDNAQDILGVLYEKNHLDPETMGIYGRTWMDRYEQSNDINDLRQSRDLYAEAFEKAPDDYYTGINAAAKSVMIGTEEDWQKANEYAERVSKITGQTAVANDYWKTATIAETFLIRKRYREAAEMYKQAIRIAPKESGSHDSTWQQVKKLMARLQPQPDEVNMLAEAFGRHHKSAKPPDRSLPSTAPAVGAAEPPAAAEPVEPDEVGLGSSAPAQVAPSQKFTARFVAYPQHMEAEVEEKLEQMNPEATHILGTRYCTWRQGTNITVKVYGDHLQAEPADDSFKWTGKIQVLNFDITVAKDAPAGTGIELKYDVIIGGFVVARLRSNIRVAEKPGTETVQNTGVRPYRTAFASYASKDRLRVLDHITEIVRNGVDVFLDCLDMNPGEKWQERIENEIRKREVFMLFWSSNAKNSMWVDKEWRMAFNHRGGASGIDPHPLEDPSLVAPPEELQMLHFNDIYMIIRKAYGG